MWLVGPSRTIVKHRQNAKRIKFLGSRFIPPSTPPPSASASTAVPPLVFVSNFSIEKIRSDAWEQMFKSLFQVSLLPSQLEINSLAQLALDNALGPVPLNGNYFLFFFRNSHLKLRGTEEVEEEARGSNRNQEIERRYKNDFRWLRDRQPTLYNWHI
jgi:hypothetical protein